MRDVQLARKTREQNFEERQDTFQAVLLGVDYTDNATVARQPGFVWFRELGVTEGTPGIAFNRKVPALVGLKVTIKRWPKQPFDYEVIDWDPGQIKNLPGYNGTPLLAQHGRDHEPGGYDPINVYPEMLTMLRTDPAGGLKVNVSAYRYILAGESQIFGGYNNYDLEGYLPASGQACYVLIYLDTNTNALDVVTGDPTVDLETVEPERPEIPMGNIGSAFVRLAGGQTEISRADLKDAREWLTPAGLLDVANWWHVESMSGRLWGGFITNNGDGTVAISAGQGLVKDDAAGPEDVPTALHEGQGSKLLLVSWPDIASLALTDNAYNYLYYDSFTGTIAATTDFYSISFTQDFTIGRVYRASTTVTIRLCGTNLWNFDRRVQLFGEEVFPIVRAKGMVTSETGERYLQVTAGVLWAELVNRFSTDALDTSGTDRFTYWYRNGSGGWTSVADRQQINNTNYDDGDGTLGTLTANRYGVHWIYMVHDSTLHVVYGQGNYILANAQDADPPASIPGLLAAYSTLIAKIIVQKSAANLYSIEYPWTTTFTASGITDHNDLAGLQGGDVGSPDEYYHLTYQKFLSVRQNYTDAVIDPTQYDDIGAGWEPGSIWINVSTGFVYICLDNTIDNAVWVVLTTLKGISQLATLDAETIPASGDLFLLEDGSTGELKKVDFDDMPSGAGATDKIEEGNSSVEVIDAGTGEITVVVDGTERLEILAGGLTMKNASLLDIDGIADGLVLDADADTTISAPTDDQIDFEAGGADRMTLTAAGLALATGARVNDIDTTIANNAAALITSSGVYAHTNASAAVHGLPASVNVLGNRNAAGQFVQHGSVAGTVETVANIRYDDTIQSVSFPVAFGSVPVVLVSTQNNGLAASGATSISTTGFQTRPSCGAATVSGTSITIGYLAIGS